jgi:hypothetical protein
MDHRNINEDLMDEILSFCVLLLSVVRVTNFPMFRVIQVGEKGELITTCSSHSLLLTEQGAIVYPSFPAMTSER